MNRHERGAVSIFIVVFTALLITVITASFIQIMVQNQNQATNNDLSQSAYDSALAGVEDAKRALIRLRECQQAGEPCANTLSNAMNSSTDACTQSLRTAGISFASGADEQEVGSGLNQAYTCVKIQLNTRTVKGDLSGTKLPDVKALDSGNQAFSKIRLSWFSDKDLPVDSSDPDGESLPARYNNDLSVGSDLPVDNGIEWPSTQPPLLRAQLIQFEKNNLDVRELNDNPGSTAVFLYPNEDLTGAAPVSEHAFNDDKRRASSSHNRPKVVNCQSNFNAGNKYLCSTIIDLPALDGGAPAERREAYLQLTSYYGGASYEIELLDDDGNSVDFKGVQPIVDSTGRASDLFRRVRAHITVTDSGPELPFPETALYVRDNLCKDFFVTNNAAHYSNDTDGVACEVDDGAE